MEWTQELAYCNDRQVAVLNFYRLEIGDRLRVSGVRDEKNLRAAAYNFGVRHKIKLRVAKVEEGTFLVERVPRDEMRVQYGLRGGRPTGAEAQAIDALEAGGLLLLPWRVEASGQRINQGALWQMIKRAILRGERMGKAFYSGVRSQGVEVKRIK